MVRSPAKNKEANKDVKIYVVRSTSVHNLLFCVHTLCMNNVTNTFLLLVPQYGVNNYCVLCTVKVKKENKNILQRILSGIITILLYWLWFSWRFSVDGRPNHRNKDSKIYALIVPLGTTFIETKLHFQICPAKSWVDTAYLSRHE